jgi:hypothetical protein
MPIIEKDPWRLQYFAGVQCPPDLVIPTDDEVAWQLFPMHRWVYDKLRIARSQDLTCGTHEHPPPHYPVFCKPFTNLLGMGMGIHVLHDARDFARWCVPGHFWMPLFSGDHVSTDMAVVQGEPAWIRHTCGVAAGAGTFDYWTVEAVDRAGLSAYCSQWVRANLAGYSGFLNLESIGGRLIEVHLRFADQWPDLYGAAWLEAMVDLYAHARWRFDDAGRRDGFSAALFAPHGRRYAHPPPALIERLLRQPGISSVQITFHEDRDGQMHAMPPGGFRLAIVNAWTLQAARQAREELGRAFAGAETARPDEDAAPARRSAGGVSHQ